MELGCDAVLLDSVIAHAKNPIKMAGAMKLAIEAGRLAIPPPDAAATGGRSVQPAHRTDPVAGQPRSHALGNSDEPKRRLRMRRHTKKPAKSGQCLRTDQP